MARNERKAGKRPDRVPEMLPDKVGAGGICAPQFLTGWANVWRAYGAYSAQDDRSGSWVAFYMRQVPEREIGKWERWGGLLNWVAQRL